MFNNRLKSFFIKQNTKKLFEILNPNTPFCYRKAYYENLQFLISKGADLNYPFSCKDKKIFENYVYAY